MTTRPRVLLVDDDQRNLSLLEAVLAPLDVATVRATGGAEGIDCYRSSLAGSAFDLVLLDVMMPDIDGFAALAAMRESTPAGERVPIILVTALTAREDRLRGLEAGADDFLTKPLESNEVRCRVKTFLALREAQRTLAERARTLERLQRERAELSRLLVHDLKNPLAALDSNLNWLARQLESSTDSIKEAVEDSSASTSRLLALVGGLVEIDRAESGKLVANPKPLAIGPFLESVARRHRRDADLRGISIEVDVDSTVVGSLDEALFTRVLENLVENASRFAGRSGRIRLAAKAAEEELLITVENTGVPIPAEVRGRLFEKFATSERGGAHQGLGLYLCRLVAETHGGSIGVESTATWPTRFAIRVPRPRERPQRSLRPRAFVDEDG